MRSAGRLGQLRGLVGKLAAANPDAYDVAPVERLDGGDEVGWRFLIRQPADGSYDHLAVHDAEPPPSRRHVRRASGTSRLCATVSTIVGTIDGDPDRPHSLRRDEPSADRLDGDACADAQPESVNRPTAARPRYTSVSWRPTGTRGTASRGRCARSCVRLRAARRAGHGPAFAQCVCTTSGRRSAITERSHRTARRSLTGSSDGLSTGFAITSTPCAVACSTRLPPLPVMMSGSTRRAQVRARPAAPSRQPLLRAA